MVSGVESRTCAAHLAMREFVEARPDIRKGTERWQLRAIAENNWIGEEAAFTMPIPLNQCSTEDHGYHLQGQGGL
jgi:hypothetical protein